MKYRRSAAGLSVKAAAIAIAGLVAWSPSAGLGEPVAAMAPILPARYGSVAATPRDTNAAVAPEAWLPSRGRECGRHRRGRRYCQGPRRVPEPRGDAAELATTLELGTIKTVSHLLLSSPKPEWLTAAGEAADPSLQFPIDDGIVWRGLQRAHRTRGKFHARHKGLDIGASEGTPIHALQRGIVAYADNAVSGYGNLLVTVHGDGSVAFYGHCRAIYVFPGQIVERGQVVGEVGQTGLARGPHLHLEYRIEGRIRDPRARFAARPLEVHASLGPINAR